MELVWIVVMAVMGSPSIGDKVDPHVYLHQKVSVFDTRAEAKQFMDHECAAYNCVLLHATKEGE